MITRLLERAKQQISVWRISSVRKTMRKAFEKDDDFKQVYIAAVAMLFHDCYGKGNYITNYEKRNQAAEDVLDLIFKE